MNVNPLISIIVPVYNVERYLDRCVESLINQTYKNIEIILVDDGSPDNCPKICDEWAKKDERVRVIHSQNLGVSNARNMGFEASKGEFVAFADSDDWVSKDYIQDLYKTACDTDCDIVECDYVTAYGDESEVEKNSSGAVETYTTEEALRCNLGGKCFGDVIWNRLYRRAIADVRFEIGKFHEDVYWVYQVLSRASKLARLNKPLYYYFQRGDGFTGEEYTYKRIDAVIAGEKRSKFIIDNYPNLSTIAQSQFIGMCIYHSQKLLMYKIEGYKGYFKDLHFRASNIGKEWSGHGSLSAKQKIWLGLYLKFPCLTCKIRNLLKIGL